MTFEDCTVNGDWGGDHTYKPRWWKTALRLKSDRHTNGTLQNIQYEDYVCFCKHVLFRDFLPWLVLLISTIGSFYSLEQVQEYSGYWCRSALRYSDVRSNTLSAPASTLGCAFLTMVSVCLPSVRCVLPMRGLDRSQVVSVPKSVRHGELSPLPQHGTPSARAGDPPAHPQCLPG